MVTRAHPSCDKVLGLCRRITRGRSMGGSIPSRRSVIASAVLAPFGTAAEAADFIGPLTPQQRQQRVFECRRDAAQAELHTNPPMPITNGDEDRYPDQRASFS